MTDQTPEPIPASSAAGFQPASEKWKADFEDRRRARRMSRKGSLDDSVELNMVPMMALFTAMILYLLKNFSVDPVQIQPSQGTQLPESTSQIAPQEAVQVAISQRVILVNDRVVARVKDGRVMPEFKKDNNPAQLFIEPLHEALKAEGERQKMFASYNKKRKELKFKGLLTVIADKRVPFRLLTEVLYTAGQAEYGAYKFAIIKKEG